MNLDKLTKQYTQLGYTANYTAAKLFLTGIARGQRLLVVLLIILLSLTNLALATVRSSLHLLPVIRHRV
uniref:Uncharacterized protein n=1 Tax=Physcomitrium patens TaxID=3218 RepID=A0A2K1J7F7_PHYPA|nr:hypothetical protein PHYPA_020566 [Physcomitrium patens]